MFLKEECLLSQYFESFSVHSCLEYIYKSFLSHFGCGVYVCLIGGVRYKVCTLNFSIKCNIKSEFETPFKYLECRNNKVHFTSACVECGIPEVSVTLASKTQTQRVRVGSVQIKHGVNARGLFSLVNYSRLALIRTAVAQAGIPFMVSLVVACSLISICVCISTVEARAVKYRFELT